VPLQNCKALEDLRTAVTSVCSGDSGHRTSHPYWQPPTGIWSGLQATTGVQEATSEPATLSPAGSTCPALPTTAAPARSPSATSSPADGRWQWRGPVRPDAPLTS